MAIQTSYTLTFSDPNKTQTIVVPGTPNGSGKNNYDTSLNLVGPGYTAYGQSIAQNFVKILENFAGPNPPRHSIEGQLWYDTSNPLKKVLRVNNGELSSARWPTANGIYQQAEDPSLQYLQNVKDGDIWVDTSVNQLKIRFGNEWTVVGPSTTNSQNKTGSEVAILEATTGDIYPIIQNWVDGKVVEIISYHDFTPRIVIDGFSSIKAGANLTNKAASKFNGLADRANALEVTRGVIIKATEVLKNKIPSNARQTHTGTFVVESINGLIVKRNSTFPEIRLIADKNNAYITFTGTNAFMKVGLEDSSYMSFNTNGIVGINTPASVLSSSTFALTVTGGASFTSKVKVNAPSGNALELTGAAYVSNNLKVDGGLQVAGKTTVSNTLTVVDIVASTSTANIGTETLPFDRLFVKNIGRAAGPLVNIFGSVTTATYLESNRLFRVEGVVSTTNASVFNGSQNVVFTTTVHRSLISSLSSATSVNSQTYNLMVLNVPTGGASVERITKSDFLSDIYSNIFHTGMIVPFGGSTPPSGWVSCNGAALSTSTPPYVSLFETIGYQYGYSAGNFLVPNMTATTFVSTGSGTGTYLQYIIKI
jgi:hypothetical protein